MTQPWAYVASHSDAEERQRELEADLWDRDYLDLVEPAHITFDDNGRGEFAFGCVNGGLDCEYSHRIDVSLDGGRRIDDRPNLRPHYNAAPTDELPIV